VEKVTEMNSKDDDVIVISSDDVRSSEDEASDEAGGLAHGWFDQRNGDGPADGLAADYAVGASGVATPVDEEPGPGETPAEDTLVQPADAIDPESGTAEAAESEGALPAQADTAEPIAAHPATAENPVMSADSNWPQIQALFVDDPRSAVRQASDVASGAVAALVAAAKNREQAMQGWDDESTGTEELRSALRQYRDLANQVSALAHEI
jgi:hypothetical protein